MRTAGPGGVMDEQHKGGTPFSAPVQRTDNEDNETSFALAGDLKDFLIRRQLLGMESKRIEAVRLESEDWVKAAQAELARRRDRVFAFLRDHSDRIEELAQVERLKQKRALKDLPKTAERYIRQKAKQHFGRLKRPSTGTGDGSDLTTAEDSRWLLPKIPQLDAWARWFAEYDAPSRKSVRFRKNRIQVALVVAGGIGDLLKSTHLVAPVSDHFFSCDLTIITAQRAARQIVARNPYVRDTLIPVTEHALDFADRLRYIPAFDLIVVWKYFVEYIVPEGSRISRDDIRSMESESSDLRRALEKYCFSYGWPMFNFALSRDAGRLGLSAMNVSAATSGLRHHNLDGIPFFPSKQSLRLVVGLMRKPYLTVHHGFDLNYLPAKTRQTDYSSTKNISMQQWSRIVSLIRKEGFEIVQLGIVEEEQIEGVTHYLNGLTSLEETGLLIKHGLCHIDTEGGLVHLANAVHARCVVLFGPTPAAFFGHPENVNLEPSGCKACWFATQTWLIECPRNTSGPECMRGHSPAVVVDAAKRIIAEAEKPSASLTAVETRPYVGSFAETVAKAQTVLDNSAVNRVLLILGDPPSEVGSELPDGVLNRFDVVVCDDKLADSGPNDRIMGRFEYGSLLNLPRASSSADAALWVLSELESDIAPFALSEIFRVLKPGGQLVFAAIGETTGLDLARSLSAARIAFNEGGMPSAPVYSCSLRKGEARPAGDPALSRSGVSIGRPETAQGHGLAVDPRLALLEEENIRQITLVRDRFVQLKRVADEMNAVVDNSIQRGFGRDGWIWISGDFADVYAGRFFIRGWHDASESVIWSRETEDKCILMAPYPEGSSSRGDVVELQIHLAVPEASASNPRTIGVSVDDGPIENYDLSADDTILTVPISTGSSRFRGVSLVAFHLCGEAGDGKSERPRGFMRIGVKRFRYRLLNS
jgi:ADP-heptose:LPS heptosyltransferase